MACCKEVHGATKIFLGASVPTQCGGHVFFTVGNCAIFWQQRAKCGYFGSSSRPRRTHNARGGKNTMSAIDNLLPAKNWISLSPVADCKTHITSLLTGDAIINGYRSCKSTIITAESRNEMYSLKTQRCSHQVKFANTSNTKQ